MRFHATIGLVLFSTLASIFSAKAQIPNELLNGLGGLVQSGMRMAIQAEWERISPAEVGCIDRQLQQQGSSINRVIASGVGPADNRLASARSKCRSNPSVQVSGEGPSFNCGAASRPDEIAICSSSELSALDRAVATGFEVLRARYGDQNARSVLIPLLRERQTCGAEAACIKRAQLAAISAIQTRGVPIRLPDQSASVSPSIYTVDGLRLGGRVISDSSTYREYNCLPSEQYAGFTRCQRNRAETSARGPFNTTNTILHSPDGSAFYINRSLSPAFFAGSEANDDINRLANRLGPPQIIAMPSQSPVPNGMIATWGAVTLEPIDTSARTDLASGRQVRLGLLIDHIGNFQRSAQAGLPIYRLTGGAGYVWSASWGNDGRGTLRFLTIDASKLPPIDGVNPVARSGPKPLPQAQDDAAIRRAEAPLANQEQPIPRDASPSSLSRDTARPVNPPPGVGAPPTNPPPGPGVTAPPQTVQTSPAQAPTQTKPDASGMAAEKDSAPLPRQVGPISPIVERASAKNSEHVNILMTLAALAVLLGAGAFVFYRRKNPQPQADAPLNLLPASSNSPGESIKPSNEPIDLTTLSSIAVSTDDIIASPLSILKEVQETKQNQSAAASADAGQSVSTSSTIESSLEFLTRPWFVIGAVTVVSSFALAPAGGLAWAIPLLIAAYLTPTFVAFRRRHVYAWLILVLNIVLGLTGLVWLGLLVWSITGVARSALDDMSPSGSGSLSPGIADSEIRSGWAIPTVQTELFAFDENQGPVILSGRDIKAYLKNPVIGIWTSAGHVVRYNIANEIRCIAPVNTETKIQIGKTIGRSALTGIGAAIFTGRHAALGAAMLDYRFAGDETSEIVSAVIVFSDYSTLAFQCDAEHYQKLTALIPPAALSDEQIDETEEQLAKIRRMADDGPRVLEEIRQFIDQAEDRSVALSRISDSAPTFAERDEARLQLAQAQQELVDAKAVEKAVKCLLASRKDPLHLKPAS
ncbi:MAG: superinfection immunity protein [Bradyrhizobiaceae bacterium]|nr:MAG: superinfection immunity protein [Bradyrhizobiaceae bacterium]